MIRIPAPKVAAPGLPVTQSIKRAFDLSIMGLLQSIRILFFLSPFLLSIPQIARADDAVSVIETVEYEDFTGGNDYTPQANASRAIDHFGPFSVVSPQIVELNGVIDEKSPALFRTMIAKYPGLRTIRMIDCPGTENDQANLEVARMVRKAGMDTTVPRGGSVRSGGVELFLAGVHRSAEPGAEFGVHSWQDDEGNEAKDVPANDPIHANYIRYYQEIGLTPEQARAFYAFTNQTAFDSLHYMTQPELARFHILN